MNASLDWYRVFCRVAEAGSVTRASAELFVSQPAVSQIIRQLEAAHGCALFVRLPKGVALTAEGKTLYEFAARALGELAAGERRLRAQISLESGEIAIGASDMTLEYFLLPHLEKFHLLYPGVRVRITNGPTPETLEKLARDQIDFAAVSEPLDGLPPGWISTPVREIEDIFIAREERSLPLSELARVPLVLLEHRTSTRAYVDRFLAENGVAVAPEFELATSALIVQFVRRGLGIGCVVRDFAAAALFDGSVREVRLDRPIPKRHIRVVRKAEPPSRAAAELLRRIVP